jgi:hypothetical protein
MRKTQTIIVTKEYAEMLARFCKIKDVWCLPKEKGEKQ